MEHKEAEGKCRAGTNRAAGQVNKWTVGQSPSMVNRNHDFKCVFSKQFTAFNHQNF